MTRSHALPPHTSFSPFPPAAALSSMLGTCHLNKYTSTYPCIFVKEGQHGMTQARLALKGGQTRRSSCSWPPAPM